MNSTDDKILVIVGNGMATEHLLDAMGTDHGWKIRVIGDEPVHYYNRIMLSPLLGGEVDLDAITPRDPVWYRHRKTQVSVGKKASGLWPRKKLLQCDDGEVMPFDRLVFASGARSAIPDLPGAGDLPGVSGFRSLSDTEALQDWCRAHPGEPVAVIGAGLLGVEAAVGLRRLGARVTLIHRRETLMNRQLDARGSALLREALHSRGIEILTACSPQRLLGEHRVSAVEVVKNGSTRVIPAGVVVCATGIRPNIEIAAKAGIACDAGIQVNEKMGTSDPAIHALGECCQFGNNTYGLVAPIREQARVLADRLRGGNAVYREPAYVTRLKVSGLDIHSMGVVEATSEQQVLWLSDAREGVYLKAILENDRLRGALLVGDVRHSQWYFQLMNDGTDLGSLRNNLLFGPLKSSETPSQTTAKVA